MDTDPDRELDRKTGLAKAVLFIESVWYAAFPALTVIGVFVLTALTGIFAYLPRFVHLAVLTLFATAFVWLLRPLFRLRWPDDQSALRHLERRAGLPHRPATSYRDTISAPLDTAEQQALWAVHKQRLAEKIAALTPGWPRSLLYARDPFALRSALALSLIAAVVLTGENWRSELKQAVNVSGAKAEASVQLDAWITPPRYTGRAPVFLAGNSSAITSGKRDILAIPANSELVVRFNNTEEPVVRFEASPGGHPGGAGTASSPTLKVPAVAPQVHELRQKLTKSGTIVVEDSEGVRGQWSINVIPDNQPTVAIVGEPGALPGGTLAFDYRAADDYGVVGLKAVFQLSDMQGDEEGLAAPGLLMFDAPDIDITLRRPKIREVSAREQRDLTAHPWAGASVDMWLEATDEAGQVTRSGVVSFVLPERPFQRPLARALAEQRRKLLHDPDQQPLVARVLDAFTIHPDGLIDRSGVYLGIRTAYRMLLHANDRDEMHEVTDLLWEIALSVEDGDLSLAERELQALQRELQRALAENAPRERVEELMQQLREALNRYMQALIEQARRNMAEERMQPLDPNAQMIQPQDIQRMMDMIENLAKSGARDAAQQLLSELNSILQGLRPSLAQPNSQAGSPMGQALQELGEMMGRQQQLMDQTYRMPGDGQQGKQSQGTPSGDLSDQQGALGHMLQQMLDQLGQQGMQAPGALGKAQDAMRGAAEALRNGERDQALAQQGEALDQLRQGAESMAQQMQQGTAQNGNRGTNGQARGETDPLGRPGASGGEQFGERRNVVPDEMSIMRAQEVLRLLRERMNQPSRPQIELDYLERLLRGIY